MAAINKLRAMDDRMLQKAKNLPPVIDKRVAKDCWDEAWQEYLEDLKNMGDEDPNRAPPPAFMQRKCVV